jgi:signal transduction histidine kinase
MSNPTPQPPERSILDRMAPFFGLFFYSALLLGFLGLASRTALGLFSWRAAAAVGLSLASAALFQRLFVRRFTSDPEPWPLPVPLAWAYFGAQALILAALLQLDPAFLGVGFVLTGQAMGGLRPRHWPLPLAAYFLLVSLQIGALEALRAADWLSLVRIAFLTLFFIVLGLLIHQLFTQRYRLLHLVGELRRAKAAVEAAAAEREELAALRERARLAREMHDSLGHALVLVNVKLEAAQRLYARDHERGDAELEATRALVRSTMGELRDSLTSLRAPLGEREALPQALGQLAEAISGRGSLQVMLSLPTELPAPAPAADEALRKIAREALANVERHAGAQRAWLELTYDGSDWVLRISDDGRGLRPADLRKPGHFGIVGMREHAASAGGSLTIGPRPGGGSVVEARVPER